jgi:hypothetical protein
MVTNEMALAKAFRETVGIEQDKAERLAETIFDAIRDNVATKPDLVAMEQRLDVKLAAIDVKFAAIDTKFEKLVLRVGAMGVAGLGLLFGALHMWPPHP